MMLKSTGVSRLPERWKTGAASCSQHWERVSRGAANAMRYKPSVFRKKDEIIMTCSR